MKILITGGAGFIGSHIVDHLINCSHKVVVIDNLSTIKDLFIKMKNIFELTADPVYSSSQKGEIQHSALDNNKAKRLLNWSPSYELEQGLEETIDYYKNSKK